MKFGNDEYPKWSEKEEMTLIFLAAFQEWGAPDIRGELNTLFGNERSTEAVEARLKKDERAVSALRDLVASNPITIAKFWKRAGVVSADVKDDRDPVVVCDVDTIREVVSQGRIHERNPRGPTLYDKLRDFLPELDGYDVSEDSLVKALRKRLEKAYRTEDPHPLLKVSRVTTTSVDMANSDMHVDQVVRIVEALRKG